MARYGRITAGSEYRATVRRGRRVGGGTAIVYAVFVSRETSPRFGYIVSKAVGGAVVRNRVRRRLKTITDECEREGFTGFDIVIRALPAAAQASFASLREDVRRALRETQARAQRLEEAERDR